MIRRRCRRSARRRYVPVNAYFDSTAKLTPADRAKAALTALAPARGAGDLQAAGFIITGAVVGRARKHRRDCSRITARRARTISSRCARRTARDRGGPRRIIPDWTQLDFKAVSDRAIDKAKLSRNPVAIEPGRYTVILEPQAVGDLVQLIGNYSDARSADEGRSPFVKPGGGNKVGEKIVDERVTIVADPQDPQLHVAAVRWRWTSH